MAGSQEDAWSVASLMRFCLYAAVNLAFLRVFDHPMAFLLLAAPLLTILNLLFFGFSRWRRDRADRRFWTWFEFTAWTIIGLSVAFVQPTSQLLEAIVLQLRERDWIPRDPRQTERVYFVGAILVYGVFPLAAATFAGWLASRSDSTKPESPKSLDS